MRGGSFLWFRALLNEEHTAQPLTSLKQNGMCDQTRTDKTRYVGTGDSKHTFEQTKWVIRKIGIGIDIVDAFICIIKGAFRGASSLTCSCFIAYSSTNTSLCMFVIGSRDSFTHSYSCLNSDRRTCKWQFHLRNKNREQDRGSITLLDILWSSLANEIRLSWIDFIPIHRQARSSW